MNWHREPKRGQRSWTATKFLCTHSRGECVSPFRVAWAPKKGQEAVGHVARGAMPAGSRV